MASSATRVWSAGWRSKVEATTSPLTARWKSVTSSGRVSTSTTITWHSGLLVVTDWAIDCSSVVAPVRGGARTSPRWPLPTGAAMSTTLPARLRLVGGEPQPLVRVHRDGVAEVRALLGALGLGAVDAVDAHHRVELLAPLALTRLADLADHGVTATQVVLAHHRQREVDVLGTGQVARGAHERAVVEHVEDAGGRHQDVVLEDRGVGLVAGAPRRARSCGRDHGGDGCDGCRPRRPRRRRAAAGSGLLVLPVLLAVLLALVLPVLLALVLLAVLLAWSWFCLPCWLVLLVLLLLLALLLGPASVLLLVLLLVPAACRPACSACSGCFWLGRSAFCSGCLVGLLLGLLSCSPRCLLARPGAALGRCLDAGAGLRGAGCWAHRWSWAGAGCGSPRLGGLDRLDQLGLLHRAGTGDAEARGHRLEVGQEHRAEAGRLRRRPRGSLLRRLRRSVGHRVLLVGRGGGRGSLGHVDPSHVALPATTDERPARRMVVARARGQESPGRAGAPNGAASG